GMDLIDEHIDQIAELARAKNNAYILQACKDEADAAPDNDAEWCYEEPNRIVKEAMETVAAMNEPHMHPGDMGAHQEIWDRMKERFDEVSAALDWLSDKQDCARVMLIMVVNLLHKSSAPIHF
ncbi:MAG: hypothetical protein GTO63_33870, partial [Anaerolineae bacterium]|nr:hypothetical protein [Anaerolineae bacterium]NIQ82482.1 hypothetical protein [Anaerolineae bacterium]